jgi:hypothetical protein
MVQLTATMEGRWTTLQIGNNSLTETDLLKSLGEALQLWLQQIKTHSSSSRSNLPQSRNNSNQQEQNQDKDRKQSHLHETMRTSAQ